MFDDSMPVRSASAMISSRSAIALAVLPAANSRSIATERSARSMASANIDRIPGDDVVRMISTSQTGGQLQISSGGSGAWTNIAPVSWSTHTEYDGNHYNTIPDYALWFAGTFTSPLGDIFAVLRHFRK